MKTGIVNSLQRLVMSTTASTSDLNTYVDQVTKCPICLEDLNKPKCLPCIHSFCLDCIEKHYRDELPGDIVNCPVCRCEFLIPNNGVEQLPNNFFIKGLIEAKKLDDCDSGDPDPCDGCSDDTPSAEAKAVATMFCSYCQQKLCDRCSRPHSRIRGGMHKLVQFRREEEVKARKVQSSFCHQHEGNKLELYCMKCNENLCIICHVSKHQNHRCQAVVEVSEVFANTIQQDSVRMMQQEQQLMRQLEVLNRKKADYFDNITKIELDVQKRGQHLKLVADNTIRQSAAELETHKLQVNKALENVKSQLDFSLAARKSIVIYSQELLQKGNPCDITDAYKCLHTRVEELLADVKQTTIADDYNIPAFAPTSCDIYLGSIVTLLNQSSDNLVDSVRDFILKSYPRMTEDHSAVTSQDEIFKYHFRRTHYAQVEQRTGIVHYGGPKELSLAMVTAAMPFTNDCSSFEVEIVDVGETGYIAIGAIPDMYPEGRQIGWEPGSIGYHADDGGIFRGRGKSDERFQTCTVGDRMSCCITSSGNIKKVRFRRNGQMIVETDWAAHTTPLYPAVGLISPGAKVRLVDQKAWRPCN